MKSSVTSVATSPSRLATSSIQAVHQVVDLYISMTIWKDSLKRERFSTLIANKLRRVNERFLNVYDIDIYTLQLRNSNNQPYRGNN